MSLATANPTTTLKGTTMLSGRRWEAWAAKLIVSCFVFAPVALAEGRSSVPLAGPDKPYGRVFNDGFYGRVAFSPDGRKLVFVADDGRDPRTPDEIEAGVLVERPDQGEGYTGYRPAQIWVAEL